jgi:uncharacterized protein (TIGR04255 family)
MVNDEIFPNPTVKQVIFQIKFPNLFYIENQIGEFQLKIMEQFPDSSLLLKRNILIMDVGEGEKEIETKNSNRENTKKIWQFKSNNNVELNLTTNSLDINSKYHKTYNLGETDTFRETIKFVLDKFFEFVSIPLIGRVGLRYIDECPLPTKDNETLKLYYNSTFPTERFNIRDAENMVFATSVKKEDCFLHYREELVKVNDEYKIALDFDGSTINVEASKCLETTDKLHELVSAEFKDTILEPVIEHMRQNEQ